MKQTKKILCLVLAVVMCFSIMPLGAIAATTISYSPNPKVEYSYTSGVTTGTIRYISQINGSTYFNSNYWGGWVGQAGSECGTASISMALSYVGINKTPKAILDAHNGITYFTGWGPSTSNPSVATGMSNYINGNGKYSPPIVHFTTGYASGTHYVLLIGKVSSNSYLVLDPASNSTWTLSTSDAKYKSIDQVFQYYNPSAIINNDTQKPIISNVKITNVDFYGYTVTCTVSDNKGVTRVSFPTWSNYNGQDDIRWKDGTISGNTATFRVNKTDHNNENGTYTTDIYAYDAAGNYGVVYGYTAFVDAMADLETTYNGTKYILYKASVCYADAEKYCRSKGGYLAKITTAAENTAVAQLTKKYGSWCWINGSDNAQEGVWKFSSGEKIAYTNWGSGEPNSYMGTDQDYIAMHPSGEWDDSTGLGYGFICEFEHIHSYTNSVTTQPTCTKEGVRTYKCSCGTSYTEKIAKKAHSYTSSVTTQPTCTKEGVKTYKCSGCTASYTEAIAKKSHTIVVVPAVAATCTKTGLTEGKKCSACGTVTVAQTIVAAKDHKDANGDYKCDNGCGYEYDRPAPDTPSDPTDNCSCNCHKGGIAGFFFKILNFFQKLFGQNKVCTCGVKH